MNSVEKRYLTISPDGRSFCIDGNKPFFWLGDTAWAFPGRAFWEDWTKYIDFRAEQGYSVMMVNSLPQYDVMSPVWTRKPFEIKDDDQWDYNEIQEDYFNHLYRMVKYANEKGIIMAIVVIWFVHVPNARPDFAHHCKSRMTIDQGKNYSTLLVDKMEDLNVVWVVSGDDTYQDKGVFDFYDEIGRNIKACDKYHRLITTHPVHMSGEYYHKSAWLDFNMVQSSHGDAKQYRAYELVRNEWKRMPAKPVINAEPCYEGHPGWNWGHVFNAQDVRRACWWSVLSGSTSGITYGAQGVYQATRGDDVREDSIKSWNEAVKFPGSYDVVKMKNFLARYEWWSFTPVQHRLVSKLEDYVPVVQSGTGKTLMAYLPNGGWIELNTDNLSSEMEAYWWNPSSEEIKVFGPIDAGNNIFNAPSEEDWVLVVESKNVKG